MPRVGAHRQAVEASVSFTTRKNQTQPSIEITSPTPAATVGIPTFSVAFTTANFNPDNGQATCSPTPCGHVHLLIDGNACNMGANPYNATDDTSPITADVTPCPTHQGQHTVTVQLHNADHTPVRDTYSQIIGDKVTVTAQ
jgi:hypothetical protein